MRLFLFILALCSASLSCSFAAAQQPQALDHAHIRAQRLQGQATKMNLPAEYLRKTCRYESEISTPAPARRVALTFDDGPEPEQTEYILDILQRHGIRAAFFLVGQKAERHPELVAKMVAAGHVVVASHSFSHPNFHSISVEAQADEVRRAEAALPAASGLKLFRYPYGNSSCETNTLLHEMGYRIVGWHVDSCDWAFDRDGQVDVHEALTCGVQVPHRKDYVEHVLASVHAHNGGIVLMHEIHHNTLRSLETIIARLLSDGFVFGSIDEELFAASLR